HLSSIKYSPYKVLSALWLQGGSRSSLIHQPPVEPLIAPPVQLGGTVIKHEKRMCSTVSGAERQTGQRGSSSIFLEFNPSIVGRIL
ncbi:hypothetical protein LINPERHAP1_LOCUS14669, partial [Linum perenne]